MARYYIGNSGALLEVTTNTTGGKKIITQIRDTPSAKQRASSFVKAFDIRGLADELPKDTGRLRRELRLVQRSASVELRGPSYAKYVRVRQGQSRRNARTISQVAEPYARSALARIHR